MSYVLIRITWKCRACEWSSHGCLPYQNDWLTQIETEKTSAKSRILTRTRTRQSRCEAVRYLTDSLKFIFTDWRLGNSIFAAWLFQRGYVCQSITMKWRTLRNMDSSNPTESTREELRCSARLIIWKGAGEPVSRREWRIVPFLISGKW